MFIAVVSANFKVLFSAELETSQHWHDGDNGGQDFHGCSQCEPERSIQIQLKKPQRTCIKETKVGSGVKRTPHGCGVRGYRDVFTPTLRNAHLCRMNRTF